MENIEKFKVHLLTLQDPKKFPEDPLELWAKEKVLNEERISDYRSLRKEVLSKIQPVL